MPRNLPIANGSMLINFDEFLNIRDLYYPMVGMMNHISGNKNRFGVWVDGRFAWLEDAGWERNLRYQEDTLVTQVNSHNNALSLSVEFQDCIYFRKNIYLRQINIENMSPSAREIRIFFSHDLCIDESDIGDTALYDPTMNVIIHYKRNNYFLMNGSDGRHGIYQYATGTKRFKGAEGTWRDAEDGNLEGNPISQGSVDSTLSFRFDIPGNSAKTVFYWLIAGHDFNEVRRLNSFVMERGPRTIILETAGFWRSWSNKNHDRYEQLPSGIWSFLKRSLLITRTQVGDNGAILAANDSDILHYNRDHYSYVWPRDGALVAYALDKAGYPEVTRPFFTFCRDGLSSGGFMWHKYHPDGTVGSSWHPWVKGKEPQLPIQEDETALVLYSLYNHYLATRDIEFIDSLFETFIKPAADFICDYRHGDTGLPLESYDLWEERRGIFTFTVASVWAGLRAAALMTDMLGEPSLTQKYSKVAEEVKRGIESHLYDDNLGRFLRGLTINGQGYPERDGTVESSLYALYGFGAFEPLDHRVVNTVKAIENQLSVKTVIGGIARYYGDYYFSRSSDLERIPGNPWFISTMWLADWHIAKAKTLKELIPAYQILEWVINHSTAGGLLSEQLNPTTGNPLSVAPLTWSHATFILTATGFNNKLKEVAPRFPKDELELFFTDKSKDAPAFCKTRLDDYVDPKKKLGDYGRQAYYYQSMRCDGNNDSEYAEEFNPVRSITQNDSGVFLPEVTD